MTDKTTNTNASNETSMEELMDKAMKKLAKDLEKPEGVIGKYTWGDIGIAVAIGAGAAAAGYVAAKQFGCNCPVPQLAGPTEAPLM